MQVSHNVAKGGVAVLQQQQQQDREQLQPAYILRGHASQINTLNFSSSGQLLYSGDADGHVVIWSLETFRPLVFFKAHAGSILTVHEWESDKFITHGRDNKIHVFRLPFFETGSQEIPSVVDPTPLKAIYTVEINALGYCKCAFMALPDSQALVAVPAVLDDSLIDVIHLPSCHRVYRSIGTDAFESKTGTVMALAVYAINERLRICSTYEDGRFAAFEQEGTPADFARAKASEGEGWVKIAEEKLHREPTMSLAIEPDYNQAWSVGADHFVARYDLSCHATKTPSRAYKTAYPGRASIAIRDDNRILAVAGWDGSVRVHSVKSFKPLAVLDYHRGSVYSVAFASVQPGRAEENHEPESEEVKSVRRLPWLAAAGQDERISLWQLYPLE